MPSEKDNGRGTPQESRKSSKPIMEKRRRARINASLMELKSLLLEVLKKEGARHNKMEKADILEMTVRHLRQIQRHQFAAAAATDPGVFNKYHTGFNECANEVSRYLSSMDGIDVDLRARLLNYLANSISNLGQTMQQMPASGPATAHVRPMQTTQNLNINMAPSPPKMVSEVNNNCIQNDAFSLQLSQSPRGKDMEGMQLLPNKISTGDLAFVIPTNVLSASGQVPSYVIPIYAGTSLASPLGIPTASLGVAPCPGQSSPATIVSPQGPQIPNIPAHISNVVHIPNNNIEIVSRNMGPMQLRLQSPSSPLQRNANIGSDDKNIADNVHNNPINHGQQADNVAVEDMWRPW